MIANAILYGLADRRLAAERPLGQVIEIYGSRRAAEKALRAVLSDEPSWAGDISVLELPLIAFPLGTHLAQLVRVDHEHEDGITVRPFLEPRVDDAELSVATERDRVAGVPGPSGGAARRRAGSARSCRRPSAIIARCASRSRSRGRVGLTFSS
jgi:hypothetical protein